MNFRALLMIAIVYLVSPPMTAAVVGDDEAAVAAVLDSFHQAAATADGALYFSLFAEGAVFVGTDAGERWSVDQFRTFAEPYFEAGRGWTYLVRQRHIRFAGDGATAWFDEMLWNESYGTCRGTGVLVRTEPGWRIAQYSLSFPIPNDLAHELTSRIKEHDAAAIEAEAGLEQTREPLVVLLVRHAEKLETGDDPGLSQVGRKRAEALGALLRDAGIEHVHSSDYQRTRATAEPTAATLGLELELYDPDQLASLAARLQQQGGRHLVVGHSNTTPVLVRLLGGDPGSEIAEQTEFDRLYIVTDGTPSTTLLRFGERAP